MPEKTFLAKRNKSTSGYKAEKDRLTIILFCNASGDHVLKPLVIGKVNPQLFEYYRSSRLANKENKKIFNQKRVTF